MTSSRLLCSWEKEQTEGLASKEEGLGTSEWPITLKTIFALFLVKPVKVSPILGVAVWVGYRPFHLHSVSCDRFGARVLMKCR